MTENESKPAKEWRALGYEIPAYVPDGDHLCNVVRREDGSISWRRSWGEPWGERPINPVKDAAIAEALDSGDQAAIDAAFAARFPKRPAGGT